MAWIIIFLSLCLMVEGSEDLFQKIKNNSEREVRFIDYKNHQSVLNLVCIDDEFSFNQENQHSKESHLSQMPSRKEMERGKEMKGGKEMKHKKIKQKSIKEITPETNSKSTVHPELQLKNDEHLTQQGDIVKHDEFTHTEGFANGSGSSNKKLTLLLGGEVSSLRSAIEDDSDREEHQIQTQRHVEIKTQESLGKFQATKHGPQSDGEDSDFESPKGHGGTSHVAWSVHSIHPNLSYSIRGDKIILSLGSHNDDKLSFPLQTNSDTPQFPPYGQQQKFQPSTIANLINLFPTEISSSAFVRLPESIQSQKLDHLGISINSTSSILPNNQPPLNQLQSISNRNHPNHRLRNEIPQLSPGQSLIKLSQEALAVESMPLSTSKDLHSSIAKVSSTSSPDKHFHPEERELHSHVTKVSRTLSPNTERHFPPKGKDSSHITRESSPLSLDTSKRFPPKGKELSSYMEKGSRILPQDRHSTPEVNHTDTENLPLAILQCSNKSTKSTIVYIMKECNNVKNIQKTAGPGHVIVCPASSSSIPPPHQFHTLGIMSNQPAKQANNLTTHSNQSSRFDENRLANQNDGLLSILTHLTVPTSTHVTPRHKSLAQQPSNPGRQLLSGSLREHQRYPPQSYHNQMALKLQHPAMDYLSDGLWKQTRESRSSLRETDLMDQIPYEDVNILTSNPQLDNGNPVQHIMAKRGIFGFKSQVSSPESFNRRFELKRISRDLSMSLYPRPDTSPQLRYTPIDQTVSPGSPVSFKCSAQGSPPPIITWTRDHQPLIHSHRTMIGSFVTSMGEVVSHVNISDISVRDGGLYTCTAHNVIGSTSHSAKINVYGSPFIRSMPNVTALAGDDVHLYCPAGGFPTPSITWNKDGQNLHKSRRHEMLHNGSLIVRSAAHGDIGKYSCVASNRQGQTAASHVFLQILRSPEIEPFSFGQRPEEGRRAQLSCVITAGDLPMTINWLKDGQHMQHDPDVESKQMNEFSTQLFFKNLRDHHSGSYTCKAANAAASVNHTAVLRVKVSPRWIIEPSSSSALVGSSVSLECNARGYPQPVITWKKASSNTAQDFQPVILDGIRHSLSPNGSLMLMETSMKDAGWYQCHADNSIGKGISKVVQLSVHAPARVMSEGGRVTGHSGQTVSLTCEATGDIPLTLTWQRHHTPITSTHRMSVRETGVGGMLRKVLEIRSVTSDDAGSYSCLAENSHGHSTQSFTLEIIEPPAAPSNVILSGITSRSATITWTLPQPASVSVQYKAKDESWAVHGRNISVGQWTSFHMLKNLAPYQAYSIRLFAYNDLGVSQPSPVHVFTTLEEAPSAAPRDVQVTAGGARSLVIWWRSPDPVSNHGSIRGYRLILRQQNIQGHITHITRPVTVSSGKEMYEVTGLSPSSLYDVAVGAFNMAGSGPLSTPRIVQATKDDAPICSPEAVSCRSSGRGALRIWWSPPPVHCTNVPVSGYKILATPASYVDGTQIPYRRWEARTTNLEKNLEHLLPSVNISVRIQAYNDMGESPPSRTVFCMTEDDVPGPPLHLRIIVTSSSSVLVTWSAPQPRTGDVLHYTLYSARENQVAVRDVVGAGGSEATWRELINLRAGVRVQVWVTATTVAGEGNPSPKLTAVPSATLKHEPIAVGDSHTLRVGMGASITLGCKGIGTPPPAVTWTKDSGYSVGNSQMTQILPGGDLHLTGVHASSNYTCWVKNSEGTDSIVHQVIMITKPGPPVLHLSSVTHDTINLTITPTSDGGTPILGYTLHHRGQNGEWAEMNAEPGTPSVVLRGLDCGATYHLYVTAWNSQSTSQPSPVLIAHTQGKVPGRPNHRDLIEVNDTCITLRLYAWPEMGCAITHWKVEMGSEDDASLLHPLRPIVPREETDIGLCELSSSTWHMLKLTAISTAGETSAIYRVATRDHADGAINAETIQEILIEGGSAQGGLLNVHVMAGIVSALLLTTAVVICVCVALRKYKYGGYRPSESPDTKGDCEEDNTRNCERTQSHLYSPTPTKKSRGSLASLKTQDEASDCYEIYPYSTLSIGNSEAPLEYGLSLHSMTPRDCLDHPTYSYILEPPAYGHASRGQSQSIYAEKEISYISNNRGKTGEYSRRTKSISERQPTPGPNTQRTADSEAEDQKEWAQDDTDDTKSCHSRSLSQARAPTTRRDSSPESNDTSSLSQQHQHYQHPQKITPYHHHPQKQIQTHPQVQHSQHPQGPVVAIPVATGKSRPLPPVRLVR